MQLTSALLFALLGAISVSANCNEGGLKFVDKNDALYHIGRACRGYDGIAGAFQGWFNPNQQKYVCVNGKQNTVYNFVIQNLNQGAGFDLDDGDCDTRLGNEVRGCDRGGLSYVSGWKFDVWTTEGRC